jgi:hypothetical protein
MAKTQKETKTTKSPLRLGKNVKSFDDIPVGDVFAYEGCFAVFYKVNTTDALLLDFEAEQTSGCDSNIIKTIHNTIGELYTYVSNESVYWDNTTTEMMYKKFKTANDKFKRTGDASFLYDGEGCPMFVSQCIKTDVTHPLYKLPKDVQALYKTE